MLNYTSNYVTADAEQAVCEFLLFFVTWWSHVYLFILNNFGATTAHI